MISFRVLLPFVIGASVAALAGCGSPASNTPLGASIPVQASPVAKAGEEAATGPHSLRWPMTLIELGQIDSGVAAARALLDARGDDPAFAIKVARITDAAGRPAAAGDIYRQVLGRHPDHVDALVGDGVMLARADQLDAAMARFRQALVLSPGDVAARNNLAMALILTGQSAQAVPILEVLSQETGASDPSDRVRANLALAQGSPPPIAVAMTRPPTGRGAPSKIAEPLVAANPVPTPGGLSAELLDDPLEQGVGPTTPAALPVGVSAELPVDPPEHPVASKARKARPVPAATALQPEMAHRAL